MLMQSSIPPSELIINDDGTIYHLGLRPEDIGNTVITVGDPQRVARVSAHLDIVDRIIHRREFVTHVGTLRGNKITIISTGIGTDNIDIVLNELDALVNIDLEQRVEKDEKTSLNIIRIGTSGTIRSDIPLDSVIKSQFAIGLDALGHYYAPIENNQANALSSQIHNLNIEVPFYTAPCSLDLQLDLSVINGITVTAPGFYAPQNRSLRLSPRHSDLLTKLDSITYQNLKVTNLEMETSGIYVLSHLLGHRAVSYSAILANRIDRTFSRTPRETVDRLIQNVLAGI